MTTHSCFPAIELSKHMPSHLGPKSSLSIRYPPPKNRTYAQSTASSIWHDALVSHTLQFHINKTTPPANNYSKTQNPMQIQLTRTDTIRAQLLPTHIQSTFPQISQKQAYTYTGGADALEEGYTFGSLTSRLLLAGVGVLSSPPRGSTAHTTTKHTHAHVYTVVNEQKH